MKKVHKPNSGRAFTLIELLVVIAIIAILFALLMPSFAFMRARVKSVKCMSNLRQMAAAWQFYVQDARNQMLPSFGWCDGAGDGITWFNKMMPYSGPFGLVRICPEAPAQPNPIMGSTHMAWSAEGSPCPVGSGIGSYGINNRAMATTCQNCGGEIFGNIHSITQPGRTPIVLDANWVDIWPTYPRPYSYPVAGWDPVAGNVNESAFGRIYMWRHPGNTINGAFADGHVESLKLPDFWKLKWGPEWP